MCGQGTIGGVLPLVEVGVGIAVAADCQQAGEYGGVGRVGHVVVYLHVYVVSRSAVGNVQTSYGHLLVGQFYRKVAVAVVDHAEVGVAAEVGRAFLVVAFAVGQKGEQIFVVGHHQAAEVPGCRAVEQKVAEALWRAVVEHLYHHFIGHGRCSAAAEFVQHLIVGVHIYYAAETAVYVGQFACGVVEFVGTYYYHVGGLVAVYVLRGHFAAVFRCVEFAVGVKYHHLRHCMAGAVHAVECA